MCGATLGYHALVNKDTPQRSIRIPDEVWDPAVKLSSQRVRDGHSEHVDEICTEALREYVAAHARG